MAGNFGTVSINKKPYNIAPQESAYKVVDIPSKLSDDPRLERRIIHRNFNTGILHHGEERALDQSSASPFPRQMKEPQGIYWATGCFTAIADRIFAQRLTTASNITNHVNGILNLGDTPSYSWMVTAKEVYTSANSQTWTQRATTTPIITDAIQYGGNLYIALGPGNDFYTLASDGTTFTQRTFLAEHFIVIREQLWRSVTANIFSTVNTDPSAQVWSGATPIGDPSQPITAMDVYEDFLMIFKQDGVYSADKTGNVYPVFPGFKTLGTNPRPLGQWRGSYYFAADVGMVWEYNHTGVRPIGFDYAEPYPMNPSSATHKFAIPNATTRGIALPNLFIVGFDQWSGYTDANSSAFFLAFDGTAWHPFKMYPGYACAALGMTGGNQNPAAPTLQFAVQSRANNNYYLNYMTQPTLDPFLVSSFDTTPQYLYLPIDNGALEDEAKVLERIVVAVDQSSAGTVRFAYAMDDDIPNLIFTPMDNVQNDGFEIQTTLPPTSLPDFRRILLRMTLQATVSTASPQIRYVMIHYKQRQPQRRLWEIIILADENVVGSTGRLDSRNALKIINDLNKARKSSQQVSFISAAKERLQVYVEEVGEEIKILKGDQNPSYLVTVKLIEAVGS